MKNLKYFLALFLITIFSNIALSQNATDIEQAKQIARQQGYTEAQINEMFAKQQNVGAKSATKVEMQAIDRNVNYEQDLKEIDITRNTNIEKSGGNESNEIKIYGQDLFKNKNLNFLPSQNIPTPVNYKLSAGDELVIDIWGDVISNINSKITPEGSINIPDLGPVYINGQTVQQAEKNIKEYLSKIYSGISSPNPTTFVKVALGKTKSVTVNILGDVEIPGTYTLPSFSTIASALYMAGGPTPVGTLRDVRLYRDNKLVTTFDVYEFIQFGKFNGNEWLEDNDAIVVGPYIGIVNVTGAAKRPQKYEIKQNETLSTIIKFAAGFADSSYTKEIFINRKKIETNPNGPAAQSFSVPENEYNNFVLQDGDQVVIRSNIEIYKNRVNVTGSVWRPGDYAITEEVSNLKQLIAAAGGLRENTYMERAYINRLSSNKIKEQVSFNINDVIIGAENIMLEPHDSVLIFTIDELTPNQTISVKDEVNAPGDFIYRKGMTIADAILMAKGVTSAGTLERVSVARRVALQGEDDAFRKKTDTIAKLYHFNLLKKPLDSDFELAPFDIVFVRQSIQYKPQTTVKVSGEVNYPGFYVVEKNVVRISDIIREAKGINSDAYVKGAKLTRVLTEDEIERIRIAKQIAKKQVKDSTTIDLMEIGTDYSIAIDLEMALLHPGTYYDVVLRDGDIITIPKYNNTVKISGAVYMPNAVTYNPNFKYKDYISNAGGELKRAQKSKTYMVHMNGSIAMKGSKNFKVQPGTEIIVPMKDEKQSAGQNIATIMGIATSTASLAAMVVAIMNQVK